MVRKKRKTLAKKKQNLKLGIWFLGGLALVIFLAAFIKNARLSLWDGESRLSLIQLSDTKIELINLLPSEKKQIIWEVAPETRVEVPGGYGVYQFNKVFKLGELDGIGGPLLLRTASNFFGLPIGAYRVNGDTNLSWWDEVRLKWQEILDFNQTSREDLSYRLGQIDALVNEAMFDPSIAQEEVKVAVLNATGMAGEATNVARMLTNLGVQVVTVGNSSQQPESQITLAEENLRQSQALDLIIRVIDPKTVTVSEFARQYRADLVVVVGTDYTQLQP